VSKYVVFKSDRQLHTTHQNKITQLKTASSHSVNSYAAISRPLWWQPTYTCTINHTMVCSK